MNRDDLRRLALTLPEATEGAHQAGPDFRVANKIFATFGPADPHFANLKLDSADQEMLCASEPDLFVAIDGTWGKRGWTRINLPKMDKRTLESALAMAWRTVAPKRLTAPKK